MNIFSNMRAVALGAALAAVGATTSIAADYEFKLHHFLSPQAPAHSQMLQPWAERIMEASDGRIVIELFPSMTLGGRPPQLPRQVRDGVVDMAWIVNAYAAGAFPRTEVFELPGVHQGDSAAVNLAMHQMLADDLADDFQGVVPMFQHVHAGQAIQMAGDEVRSPMALEGMKIRTPSRTGAWMIEALGASPVQTSVGEIPVSLSRRVIDGALIPFEIIPPLRIYEQTDYQIEGPAGQRLGTAVFSVIMNQERWDGLPADIQQIFTDNSGADWHQEIGGIWDGADDFGINLAVENGNEHIELSEDEWAAFEATFDSVVQRWIAEVEGQGIDGEALYRRAQELVAQNSPN